MELVYLSKQPIALHSLAWLASLYISVMLWRINPSSWLIFPYSVLKGLGSYNLTFLTKLLFTISSHTLCYWVCLAYKASLNRWASWDLLITHGHSRPSSIYFNTLWPLDWMVFAKVLFLIHNLSLVVQRYMMSHSCNPLDKESYKIFYLSLCSMNVTKTRDIHTTNV